MGFTSGAMVKNPPANAEDTRDMGSIPGWERSPGKRNGTPLQYSSLENPTDRGAWRATAYGVSKSQTQLSMSVHVHTSIPNKVGAELPSSGVKFLKSQSFKMSIARGSIHVFPS